jgi:hypothetical protein
MICGGAYGYHAWEVKIGDLRKATMMVCILSMSHRISANTPAALARLGHPPRPLGLASQTITLQPDLPRVPTTDIHTLASIHRRTTLRPVLPELSNRNRCGLRTSRRSRPGLIHGRPDQQALRGPRIRDFPGLESYYRSCQSCA